VVLVTNAAARCGNARRAFREMAELGRRFYGSPFIILAFASNDFGQMGSEKALRDFASRHQFSGVLMARVHVNGRVFRCPTVLRRYCCFDAALPAPSPAPPPGIQPSIAAAPPPPRRPAASPVFRYLRAASGDPSAIGWNYAFFLVDGSGAVRGRFKPGTSALDLAPHIVALLQE
jgi:glutathione peroxidase-family protein